jgi:hypothetical protein
MSRIQITPAILMYLVSAAAAFSLGLALEAAGGLEHARYATALIVFAVI